MTNRTKLSQNRAH